MMPRLLTISLKDVKIWLRDPAALGVLLGMPVVLILILGSAFGGLTGEGSYVGKVAIVNLDTAQVAEGRNDVAGEIVVMLSENKDISSLFGIDVRDDAKAVRAEVERGDLIAALVVPEGFNAAVNDAKPVELEVLKDPGSELSANIWESIVRSISIELSRVSVIAQTAGTVAAQQGASPEAVGAMVGAAIQQATAPGEVSPVTVQVAKAEKQTDDFSPLDYFSVSMTSMFLLFGAMFGSFAFITERREQTMSRLLSTPTARSSFVGGKMLGIMLLGLLQFGVLYAYTSMMMKVNWGASVAGTWMVAAAELAAATGLAVLIASIAKSERGAGGVGPLVIQLMALTGGAFFQLSILPQWLQPIRYISVIGWALQGFQKVQLEGAGPSDLLVEVGALMAFAIVFFGIGVWRLRDDR
ncbi:MAG: ABC-2 transporter permease [Actinomycetota bacterium]|nr:ABC-2 transporter permease [Actinomycetota bacterium]